MAKVVKPKHRGWTQQLQELRVGDALAYDPSHYDTIRGIVQRMRREGMPFRYRLSGQGLATRIADARTDANG